MKPQQRESGFVLLITMIVVSVIITIGISILDLSIKQIQLSTNAKESESAFHAANAGMECARYVRRIESDNMESRAHINPSCFGVSASASTEVEVTTNVTGTGNVYQYDYSFSWTSGASQRCTQVRALLMMPSSMAVPLTITNLNTIFAGYPPDSSGNYSKTCAEGSRCTTISVQGYNKPCSAITSFGVVQREVLLQF